MGTGQRNGAFVISEQIDLYLFYPERDEGFGGGHEARMLGIADHWDLGNVVHNWGLDGWGNLTSALPSGDNPFNVAISDHYRGRILEGGSTLLFITVDDIGENHHTGDITLNFGAGWGGSFPLSADIFWAGFEHWAPRKELRKYRDKDHWATTILQERRIISIIPGSSPLIGEPLVDLITGFADSLEWSVEILENMDFEDYAEHLSASTIIISAASNSALEACYLGKPTLILQTASNQFHYYQSLAWYDNIAVPFSPDALGELMLDRMARFTLGSRAWRKIRGMGADYIKQEALWRLSQRN